MHPELLYQLALTLIPNIGTVQAKILLQHCEAEEIFHAKKSFLEKIEGIGPVRAASISSFKDFSRAEDEIKFIEKYKIKPLFLTDPLYPQRLLNCYDSPTMLYYKGEADLNAQKIVSIIGTRSYTDYAKQVTDELVKSIASQNITVISGLAFGGGLLTEFKSKSKPDKHNFPSRNRIVAGMSDATIVIETSIKGGSMITAELANGYNKDVFAIPGKITDSKSAGCNYLIKSNKAVLLSDTNEFLQLMGWEDAAKNKKQKKQQREIFIELTKEERVVIDILKENETTSIDDINFKSGLSSSTVAVAILNLELQNVILSLPGKLYKIA